MKRGLVVGKFYPPHKGHKYLIETAQAQCDEVTVLVCHLEGQRIPGELRARWIEEMVPGVIARSIPDIIAPDDSHAWAQYTIALLGYVPDVVFTSEDYGAPYARFMGCEHVLVDKARVQIPISATKIRSSVVEYWGFLEPCVQDFFKKKIVVIGAESTGTTTLAQELAQYYSEPWVSEYGRMYSEMIWHLPEATRWNDQDFEVIARTQADIGQQMARKAKQLLILDTDALATTIWQERYLGHISGTVAKIAQDNQYDAYILTGDEIPFVQDGLRDGEHIRHGMHQRFRQVLTEQGKKHILVRGSREARLKEAVAFCDSIIQQQFEF